jgi:hypothetical protein
MNYAVLNKFRADNWDTNRLCESIRRNASKISYSGYVETVLYLSHTSPDVCYAVSFWYSKKAIEEFFSITSHTLYGASPDAAILEESTIFQLGKEWRQLHLTAGASTIRLSQLPPSVDFTTIQRNAQSMFKQKHLQPGLIGAWWGYNTLSPNIMLVRLDWQTLKDQQNYFCNPTTQEIITSRLMSGFELEYASLSLNPQILLTPDLKPRNGRVML